MSWAWKILNYFKSGVITAWSESDQDLTTATRVKEVGFKNVNPNQGEVYNGVKVTLPLPEPSYERKKHNGGKKEKANG